MQQVTIKYTETFFNSTELSIAHFSRWNDEISVVEKIEDTIEIFEKSVTENPLIYNVSNDFFDMIGISSVREANINGYRILYEVEEQGKEVIVTLILLLGQKQSIKEQLIKHCLMHK